MPPLTSDEVRQWLQEICQRELGAGSEECFVRGPSVVRNNSRLFYAECMAFPSPIAVKVCLKTHTRQADPDSAHRQYDALHRVSLAMGIDTEFSAPRPYLVQADDGLLAMEWVSGVSMTDLVFSWRCSLARARQLVARGGRWLKRFHASHALAPGRLDIEDKLAFVAEMESSGAISDRVFIRALRQLRESAKAAAAVTLSRSWIHGDFKTDNLIVSGARTMGIDIQLRHEGPVIYDLAPFLNHLELRLCHPGGWRLFDSQALLHETFLANYLEGRNDAIAGPLTWIRLYMILAQWHTARTHSGSWLRYGFLNFCYRRVAARLVSRIARQGWGHA